ncbi:peroxisomal ATPase PEX1-like [Engraulis encrasicolus]|uniref:peroxisomal ATPase PEX1-like n=1 Tax=Engraulis encrasicolus TaxID=184585 RepID=UPI002FD6C965
MLGSHGIQPVTLVLNNSKNCFLHLPTKLITKLSLHENQILELSWDDSPSVFLSWTRGRHAQPAQEDNVELCRQLADKLGLKAGEQGFLRPCQHVQSVHQVYVEPLSSDDWEILELHSLALEQQLLGQIRAVYEDGIFPVWVDQRTCIYIKIASLSPSVPYGRLEQFTELMVAPKMRSGDPGTSLGASAYLNQSPSPHTAHPHASDQPLSSISSLGTETQESPNDQLDVSQDNLNQQQQQQQWGGIADFKSLLRYVFTGGLDPAKEPPPVPSIPASFSECVLRVCRTPPRFASHHCAIYGEVHMLPLGHHEVHHVNSRQPLITYGKISKMASPKEVRERAKQAMEGRKRSELKPLERRKSSSGGGGAAAAKDGEEEEVVVEGRQGEAEVLVRVKCHLGDLDGDHADFQRGELHSGRLWIPKALRSRLQIDLHSTVRLKPVKSNPRVALSVRLQPVQPMAQAEGEEELRTSFLEWLYAQSHEPLVCLTARSDHILLPSGEGKAEFALTVLKPDPSEKDAEELFFLSSVLQKTDIQVVLEPLSSDSSSPVRDPDETHEDFPLLSHLGAVEEISRVAFEHVSHSLMGKPLSRELVAAGIGLRSGAVLITGAKGSGKSSLAKAVCRRSIEELDVHVDIVDCKMLKGKRAETVRQRLEEVFEQALWRQPSVVLLEDLDIVTAAATSPEHEHGPDAMIHMHIAQSLKDVVDDVMERGSLVALVATAQSKDSLHPSLREVQGTHFFQTTVHIQSPDQDQRVEILRCLMLRKSSLSPDCVEALDLEAVAKQTEGYVARDLALLLERAVHASVVNSKGHSSALDRTGELRVTYKDFVLALRDFTAPSLWSAELHSPGVAGMESVGGLGPVRQMLEDTILLPAKYPLLFSSLPIRQCTGVLLYGAPGTGKTLLAGAVAKESGMNFICIKGPELLSKYIGASEQAVRDVFQRAQAAKPCILFFDEFDSLAPRRGHDSTGVTDRVVNQLLTQLDGVEGLQGVYVLAATSRPDLIDPALLRPGRLDKSLYCPPPDQEGRLEILRALSRHIPLGEDVDLEELAVSTDSFTGADLKALLYNAQLEAIHNSPGASLLQELGSGSDSDVSLSSMIFLNPSSGSDDSAGEGDSGLEPPAAAAATASGAAMLLEHAGEHSRRGVMQANAWRLYFGSSYESELDNPSPPDLVSH